MRLAQRTLTVLALVACAAAGEGDDTFGPVGEAAGPPPQPRAEATGFENANCGIRSLRVLRQLLGVEGRQEDLLHAAGETVTAPEASVADIVRIAAAVGLELLPMRGGPSDLASLDAPAIIHLAPSHFVVLEYMRPGGAVVVDPSQASASATVLSVEQVADAFSGVVLAPTIDRGASAPRVRLPAMPLIAGISAGAPGRHVVSLRNTGQRDLELALVSASCGCIGVASAVEQVVHAGGVGQFELTITATGVRTAPTPLVMTFRSNAPGRSLFHVGLWAQASPTGWATRSPAAWIRAGEDVTGEVRFTLNHPADVIEAATDVDWAEPEAVATEKGERTEGHVRVRLLPTAPIGVHEVSIAVAFRSEAMPVLPIVMEVRVSPVVIAAPSVLAVDPGVTRESVLRWDPEEVVSDLTVSTENLDGCEVMYERTGDGEGKVTIVPPAEAPTEVTTGWVRLTGTLASGLERVVGEVKVHLLPVDPFAVM